MLDQKNQDAVMLVVQDLVAKNAMFTHYDITSNVRNVVGCYVPHYGKDGVQQFVADLWLNDDIVFVADYTRSLTNLPNGKQALVYHNANDDVCDYDPSAAVAADPAPSTVFTPDPVNTSDPIIDYDDNGDQGSAQVPFDSDDVVYRNTDLRYRLGVPASMIRQLGVAPGEVVTVFPFSDNNTYMLVVCRGDKTGIIDDAIAYTVARDGEIRISNTMISNVGLGYTSKFAIEYDTKTEEIVISPC